MGYSYIKMIRDSEEALFLDSKPIESHVLRIIAKRARRKDCPLRGLLEGEAQMGDFSTIGITRQQYRNAILNLKKWGFVTTNPTNQGTIVKLLNTSVYDINIEEANQQNANGPTSEQPTSQPASNQQANQRANQQATTNKKERMQNNDLKNDKNDFKNERSTHTPTRAKKFNPKFTQWEEWNWPCAPDEEMFNAWLLMRRTNKYTVSVHSFKLIGAGLREAVQNRLTIDECLAKAEIKGWKGFEYAWMHHCQDVAVVDSSIANQFSEGGRELTFDEKTENITNENKKGIVTIPDQKDVVLIFKYWQSVMNKQDSKLTEKRKDRITDRLKDGYSIDNIQQAITNCASSTWYMGQNDSGQVFDDIELICRTPEKLENLMKNMGVIQNAKDRNYTKSRSERVNDELHEIARDAAARAGIKGDLDSCPF